MKVYSRLKSIISNKNINQPLFRSSNDVEYIFIHINKNAGTSLYRALGFQKKQHLMAREIIDIVGEDKWDSLFKITVVRNPWDKVYSHYKYRVKTNQTMLRSRPLEFNEWLSKTYGSSKDFYYYDYTKMFQPQVDWLKNHEEKIDIDYILRFENLEKDFKKLKNILGLNTDLPFLNKTDKTPYQDMYNDESKSIIEEVFKEDIKLFNYQFKTPK